MNRQSNIPAAICPGYWGYKLAGAGRQGRTSSVESDRGRMKCAAVLLWRGDVQQHFHQELSSDEKLQSEIANLQIADVPWKLSRPHVRISRGASKDGWDAAGSCRVQAE